MTSLTWRFGFERLQSFFPGIVIAVTIAMAAAFLSSSYGAPVMLFALLLGIAFNFLNQTKQCQVGIEFSAKKLLRFGIVLLGARITLDSLASLGIELIIFVAFGVVLTILFGALLAKVFGLEIFAGVLTGGAVAICGASAAMAISSVMPNNNCMRNYTTFTVISVTALSTVAMILYPAISLFLGMNELEAGYFIGGTIHDVAQVVGAGYSLGEVTGDISTIVKLLRVSFLLPLVVIISVLFRAHRTEQSTFKFSTMVPSFLFGFLALAIMNSVGVIPEGLSEVFSKVSYWSLLVAISAMGVKTSVKDILSLGWKPVILVVVETLLLAIYVVVGMKLVI